MPFPRHQLDIIICPNQCDFPFPTTDFTELLEIWQTEGLLGRDHVCNPQRPNDLIEGGFGRVYIDQPHSQRFYANHQGGYAVKCPNTQGNLVPNFIIKMQEWRQSQDRSVQYFSINCELCQQSHPLQTLNFQPQAVFAMGALVFQNVESVILQPRAQQQIAKILPDYQTVLKRVG